MVFDPIYHHLQICRRVGSIYYIWTNLWWMLRNRLMLEFGLYWWWIGLLCFLGNRGRRSGTSSLSLLCCRLLRRRLRLIIGSGIRRFDGLVRCFLNRNRCLLWYTVRLNRGKICIVLGGVREVNLVIILFS
jgi:hypothetical protein